FLCEHALSCTTFGYSSNQGLIFGKMLDWDEDHGMLIVNKRNMAKQGLTLEGGPYAKWVSKYGSLTFNQHGREFPMGGVNEAGLVVEVMVGDAEYPARDDRGSV